MDNEAGPTPTYCTPEDVAETLDLPSPEDRYGFYQFSDASHPSYNQVCKMILSNEQTIDNRLRKSWRLNKVVDHLTSIQTQQKDENARRVNYYLKGGDYIKVHKDMLPWDPSKGDRLLIRTRMSGWVEYTDAELDESKGITGYAGMPVCPVGFWIDYEFGKMYLYTKVYQSPYNSVRISYRYGDLSGVPADISRLCCLMTAIRVINMQTFNIKVGMGGDISGVKNSLIKNWQDEIGEIYSSRQRMGSVRGLW